MTDSDPEYLADHHGIGGEESLLQTSASALQTLATGPAGGDAETGSGD